MITGFNTDIVHGGTTYHVQTEDKGLDSPIILSLVYVGGAILAAKRAPYDDLIASGFDEAVLTERLQRQHKLICAAIKAGRVEDLKRAAQQTAAEKTKPTVEKPKPPVERPPVERPKRAEAKKPAPAAPLPPPPTLAPSEPEVDFMLTEADIVAVPPPPAAAPTAPPSILELLTDVHAPVEPPEEIIRVPVLEILPPDDPPPLARSSPAADSFLAQEAEAVADGLYLKLLDDEGDFRAGQFATIKIYAGRGRYGRHAVGDADVTVKVLGTTFRPLLLSTKTNEEGVAVVRAILPRFTSGRAAILIRATTPDGETAELRRIIHQA